MRTILSQIGTSLTAEITSNFFDFNNIENNTIQVNIKSQLVDILKEEILNQSDSEIKNLTSRLPPLEELPYSKNIRCPKDLNIVFPKERRNKKRIVNNDRDITPFSKYYQN